MAENLTYYDSTLTGQELDEALRKIPQIEASAEAAADSAEISRSWAQGGTGAREGEEENNAKYWCEQAEVTAKGALGWYADQDALQAKHPTGTAGQWAIVGADDALWLWSQAAGTWVETGGSRLYRARFALDAWTGDGPCTQTAAVTPVDGGPPVTADTVLYSGFGVDDTLGAQAYRVQMGLASRLGRTQNKTFGAGTLTLTVAKKPTADAELYFMAKKGGA